MPRAALGEITGNSRKGKDLDSFQLGQISAYAETGVGATKQGQALKLKRETLRDAVQRVTTRSTTTPAKKTGRPVSYTPRDKRAILRIVKVNPRIPAAQIKNESGVKRSVNTIKKILKECGVRH